MFERAIDWVLPKDNPARVVYGLITIGALLAAEGGLHETYPEAVGSVVLTTALYWLAHTYAELLGHRLAARQRLTIGALLRALGHERAIVRGAAVPLLALIAAWIASASLETAVGIAVWSCAASLLVFELLAGVRARATPAELLLEGSVGLAMALGIVTLRVILH